MSSVSSDYRFRIHFLVIWSGSWKLNFFRARESLSNANNVDPSSLRSFALRGSDVFTSDENDADSRMIKFVLLKDVISVFLHR